jgi:ketosteroid isomerase-like protein
VILDLVQKWGWQAAPALQDSYVMNSVAGPVEPRSPVADSPNMRVVKHAFEELKKNGGMEAAVEHLLRHSHSNVEFRPYVANGRILRGPDEVRAFYREQLATGTAMEPRPMSFEECGDEVVVQGSLRVVRPTGGFAESQLSWTYCFRDGRLQSAHWGPHRAIALSAEQ